MFQFSSSVTSLSCEEQEAKTEASLICFQLVIQVWFSLHFRCNHMRLEIWTEINGISGMHLISVDYSKCVVVLEPNSVSEACRCSRNRLWVVEKLAWLGDLEARVAASWFCTCGFLNGALWCCLEPVNGSSFSGSAWGSPVFIYAVKGASRFHKQLPDLAGAATLAAWFCSMDLRIDSAIASYRFLFDSLNNSVSRLAGCNPFIQIVRWGVCSLPQNTDLHETPETTQNTGLSSVIH